MTIRNCQLVRSFLSNFSKRFCPHKRWESRFLTFLVGKIKYFLFIFMAMLAKGKSRIDGVLLLFCQAYGGAGRCSARRRRRGR